MVAEHWSVGHGVEVWLAAVDDVPTQEWPTLFSQMEPQRQSRCLRYRREEDRARCVLADALARHALSLRLGVAPAAIPLAKGDGGKPYAVGLPVHFSLSHSGALVLCALAPFPVGADVQRHIPVSDALLARCAKAGYTGHTPAAFFRWWCRQEAAGKLSGAGFSFAPLPEGLWFSDGRRERDGADYAYSICAHRAFLSRRDVI